MPGCGEFELEGKVIQPGGNKQNAGNDSLIAEKSGERSGPTKPVEGKYVSEYCNLPDGQKVY